MILVHKVLQASNPVKRWVVLTGMKAGEQVRWNAIDGKPAAEPAVHREQPQLDALYAKALPLAERLILEILWQSWTRTSRWTPPTQPTLWGILKDRRGAKGKEIR